MKFCSGGKRIDNGEWVCGTPFQEYSNFWGEWEWIIQTKHPLTNVPYMHLQIDRKTVGQFTGLTDKNGKKIFEGDIVQYTNKDGTPAFYEVVWGDACGAWMLKNQGGIAVFSVAGFHLMIEVIGNIHDNPELLKVGAEDGK